MAQPAFLLPLAENRADVRCAWRGPAQLVVEPDGTAGRHPLTGFFFRQTRFLRHLRLLVDGRAPHPCSCAEVSPGELEFTFVFPEVDRGGGGGSGSGGLARRGGLLFRDLDLRLRYRVRPASLEAVAWITSRWQDVEVEVAWVLSADYASVDEAHFDRREQEAPVEAVPGPGGELRFRYTHARLPFETHVAAGGAAWRAAGGGVTARLALRRQETVELALVVRAVDPEDPIDAAGEARREERLARWEAGVADLFAPGETPLVEITRRAMRDLGSFARLEGPDDEWLTPSAGVPLYLTLWGRDALTAGWQAALFDGGEMVGDVLACLDRLQGREDHAGRDEEPGRIINQAKLDPLSRLGRTPFARYYADFASPFMFVIGLGYRYALTGDRERVARHWPAALAVLRWARERGDRDGDGYLEYLTRSPQGPRHQGWKDSENAVVGADGRQVEPPVAPCEIQGYWYVALQFMAVLAVAMGERERGVELWREAAALRERFNRDFWLDDEGFVAFGLDAGKRPIAALTSNAAHCIPTGIVSREHIARLVRRLFQPDLFSGWGIRTLSSLNPAFNPLDYHLGSVWPVENATILFGLRRYGLEEQSLELATALYDLARLWPGGRVPECVGGYARGEFGHPGTYPPANRPQAWNQSVFPLLAQSLLGIVPYAPLRLLLVDPLLPPWLPEVTLRRLRVGGATVTLRFHRDGRGASHYEVVEQAGELRVLRQPWLESFSADFWERAAGLAQSLVPALR